MKILPRVKKSNFFLNKHSPSDEFTKELLKSNTKSYLMCKRPTKNRFLTASESFLQQPIIIIHNFISDKFIADAILFLTDMPHLILRSIVQYIYCTST